MKNYEKQVVPDDIIKHARFKMVKDFTINEHCALIDKIENSPWLKSPLGDKELGNLGRYFTSLPSEAAMKLFKNIGAAGIKENAIKFYQQTVDTVDDDGKPVKVVISDFLVNLLGQQAVIDAAAKKP